MKNVLAFVAFLFITLNAFSQNDTPGSSQEDAYTKTINSRAQKIVSSLAISQPDKAAKVQSIIADQYRNLNAIHTNRDERIKTIKATGDSKEVTEGAVKSVEAAAGEKIKQLHTQFLSKLATELSAEQVTKVKDGLTYNVVNITYAGYLDMLPNLTADQKQQIRTWLEEARESAMDAETAEKKHAWFGKYKGRINNYLSAAGYDLKKEGDAWQQRLKEKEAKNKTATN